MTDRIPSFAPFAARVAALALIAAAVAALPPAPGWAATFVVDSLGDTDDNNAGDGICSDGGACTLRAAIQEANALAGADSIELPAGTIQLTQGGASEDAAASGDLDITGVLILVGQGATATTVDAGALSPGFDRVFHVQPSAIAHISDLRVTGGIALDGENGGGIRNDGGLTVTDAVVAGNATTTGTGQRNGGGIYNGGDLTVNRTVIANNGANSGGGLYSSNTATLRNVRFVGNDALGSGGGIHSSTWIYARHVTLANNRAGTSGNGSGGGWYNAASQADARYVTAMGNQCFNGIGGVLYNRPSATMTLADLFADNNTAASSSGAGGAVGNSWDLTLNRATILNGNAGDIAGGIYNDWRFYGNHITVANSSAPEMGGIYTCYRFYVDNLTLTGNEATSDFAGGMYNCDRYTGTGLYAENNTAAGDGGGIYHDSLGDLHVTDVVIRGNASATTGGGLINGYIATLENAVIEDNTAWAGAGVWNQHVIIFRGGEIRNNVSSGSNGDGAGLLADGSTFTNFYGTAISGNTASRHGGGIAGSGNVYAEGLTLANNRASNGFGGGMALFTGGSSNLTSLYARANSATAAGAQGLGGGLYLQAGAHQIDTAKVLANESERHGGGIYLEAGATLTLTEATVAGNTTTNGGWGGGLFSNGTLTVHNSRFWANHAHEWGGGIYNRGTAELHGLAITTNTSRYDGGGIYNEQDLRLTRSTLANNGAIGWGGGGGFANEGTASVFKVAVTGNVGLWGGGIANYAWQPYMKLYAERVTLASNHAVTEGGGLWHDGHAALTDVAIYANTTSGEGGGIWAFSGWLIGERMLIAENSAENAGGGIYAGDGGHGILVNATLAGNAAAATGGGMFLSAGATWHVTHATVAGNQGDSDGVPPGLGGGIYLDGGTAYLANTILAANLDGSAAAPNCGGSALTSVAGTLLDDGTGCAFSGGPGDQLGIAPLLDSPAAFTGITQAFALDPTSPAVDAGADAHCQANDQRNRPRGFDGDYDRIAECDLGAIEQAVPAPEADLAVVLAPGSLDLVVGDGATVTATVTNLGPNPSSDATLTLLLPGMLSFVAAPGCSESGGVVSCVEFLLDPGDWTVTVDVTAATAGSGSLDASVAGPTADPVGGNNDGGAGVTVVQPAAGPDPDTDPTPGGGTEPTTPAPPAITLAAAAVELAAAPPLVGRGSLDVPMAAVRFAAATAGSGTAAPFALTVAAGGGADDVLGVRAVKVYHDANGNGAIDAGEALLGEDDFADDNGSATIALRGAPGLADGEAAVFLVAYDMWDLTTAALPAPWGPAGLGLGLLPLGLVATGGRRRRRVLLALLLGLAATGTLGAGCSEDGRVFAAGFGRALGDYTVQIAGLAASHSDGGTVDVEGLPVAGRTIELVE